MPDGGGAKYPVGENVEAGLPNITGDALFRDCTADNRDTLMQAHDAFYTKKTLWEGRHGSLTIETNEDPYYNYLYMDASRCSSIYGASDTVQPPAYTVYVYKRIA